MRRGGRQPMSDALRSIMQECEGHRFGQSGYDITLDHIYDCAEVVLTENAELRRVLFNAANLAHFDEPAHLPEFDKCDHPICAFARSAAGGATSEDPKP